MVRFRFPIHSYALFGALVLGPWAALFALPVHADEAVRGKDLWRSTILEENDTLYTHTDKHYTQGLRVSALSPPIGDGWANGLYALPHSIPTVFPDNGTRRASIFLGQSIFTPVNIDSKPPNSRDRPYGGWLYLGGSLLQETGNQLENLELDLGVVGPGAFGQQTQNDWHQFIGIHRARGWSSQIQNEPGVVLSYERLWRLSLLNIGGASEAVKNGVDFVPQLGGSAGNVVTYGEAGGMVRIGRHLEADYGPVRIRPAMSGTDYFNDANLGDDIGFYIFAGAQGRIVGHNVFLDGNTFRQSPSVTRKTFVADLQAGVSVFWSSRLRLDASVMRRTDEFAGQSRQDILGTAAFAFSW